jgi:hypothetical protein
MAFPGTYNFNYYRGDTAEFVIRPKTSSGSNFPLTSYTGQFKIANRRGSGGTQYAAQATVNTSTNIVTCTILPSTGRGLAAGTYVYDVQITNGANLIYTLLTGTMTVSDDVSGAV